MTEIKPKLHRFLHGHRGSLVKQGKVFKQWSTRFFVLEKRRLKYFEDDTITAMLGEIVIDGTVHLYDINEEVDGMKNLFYLTGKNVQGGDESLFLSAWTEKEKQDWLEAITDAVHDGFKQIFQPDLWATDFYPYIDVGVLYRKSGVATENGNIIRPSNTDYSPDVVFKGINIEDKFSFIMLDIDPISSIENPSSKYYLHWGVINISGLDIKTGEELAPYIPPAPVYNSGLHRFFFLLFKQRTFISSIVLNEITELFHKRDGFPFMKWVRLMDFGDPAGINGFYAGWEDFCDELHQRLNYIPPETFRSPNQETLLKKEQARKRIEQSFTDLYRDLALKDVFVGLDQSPVQSGQVPVSLQVMFGSSSEMVKDGQIVQVSMALKEPVITFEDYSAENSFYSLILTDPDFPSRVNPSQRELVHWVVVNIPRNKTSEGKVLLDYLPPCPPFASGLHRYVFCLFKQRQELSEEELERGRSFFQLRMGIRSYEFIKSLPNSYFLSPIGLEAFIAEWEEVVDQTHEQLQWIPPLQYRSADQNLKVQSQNEDKEQRESLREARVAELEYELKTSIMQGIAQLTSAPLPSVSPKPEPAKLKSAEKVKSLPPVSTSKVETVQITTTSKTSKIVHVPKPSSTETPPSGFRNSPINIPTIKPQFKEEVEDDSVGIVSEEWREQQRLLKAPLLRQNGLNERSFILTANESAVPETETGPSLSEAEAIEIAKSDPVVPVKTVPIASGDDLDALFEVISSGAEKENYDDDDESNENPSVVSSTASQTMPSPLPSSSATISTTTNDTRSVSNSLFKRMGLFKAQSQYMPTDDSAAKTQRQAASTSMYFKPPPTAPEESTKTKRLATSTSMYYKPFENSKLQDFSSKSEDLAEAMAKCSLFDISSSSIFAGEIMKKKFSTDFMFKDSIIWIDSVSKSLHWAKSILEKKNPQFSKYIFLNRIHGVGQDGSVKPQGELKGIFKSVDCNGSTIIVHLESDEFLELKLSPEGSPPTPKRVTDWVKVIRALSV